MTNRSHDRLTMTILVVGVMAYAMLQSLIIPVLADLRVQYGTSVSTASWVITAYLLASSVFTPLLGRVGDDWGRARVFTLSLLTIAVGCVVSALAPSIAWMLVGRALQGAAGSVMPMAFGVARDRFPDRLNSAIGTIASLSAVGFGIGIVAAGPIVDTFGLAWLFYLPAIVCLLAATAAFVVIRDAGPHRRPYIPVSSAVLLTGWLVMLLLALSKGGEWGWGSPTTVLLLSGAAVVVGLWIVVEVRRERPLVDLGLLRRRGVWTAHLVSAVLGAGQYASLTLLPQFTRAPTSTGYGLGVSLTESGLLLLPVSVASFLAGAVSARLIARVGARAVTGSGLALITVSFVVVAFRHASAWDILAVAAVQGLGTGLVITSMSGVLALSVPASAIGVANGVNSNMRTIGGSIGSAVTAAVLAAGSGVGGLPVERGYVVSFLLIGALTAACVAVTRAMPHRIVTGTSPAAPAATVPAA